MNDQLWQSEPLRCCPVDFNFLATSERQRRLCGCHLIRQILWDVLPDDLKLMVDAAEQFADEKIAVFCHDSEGQGQLCPSVPTLLRHFDGEDCRFALHDALEEQGQIRLADHFRGGTHPKGCWALDLILGKK